MKALRIAALAALFLLSAHAVTHADDGKATAKALYQAATTHYNLGEFEDALKAYREAYRQAPDPAFLFNIAQCQRQLNRPAEAARQYRAFLRERPSAKNRAAVEALIAEMDQAVREQRITQPPLGTEPPNANPTPEATPTAATPTPSPATGPPVAGRSLDAAGIALVAGGAALLAGGVGLALYSSSVDSQARDLGINTDLATRESQVGTANTLGGVGYALVGVGAAAVVAGVVKLVLRGRSTKSGGDSVSLHLHSRGGRALGLLSGSF